MSRILTVDDSPLICTMIEYILKEEKDIEINSVYTGKEALDSIRSKRPDLILLDVILPDINGYEICRILKTEWKMGDVPIIFLTAQNDVASVVEGFHAGAVDYICKPFSTVELKARVLAHLRAKLMTDKVKELEVAKELLRQQGLQDPLTNIYNRRFFIENLDSWQREAEQGRNISFLMGDIDDFKYINDKFGHMAGDHVLITLAEILKKAAGRHGTVGRWGGEEFLMVMMDTDLQDAEKIARIICDTVSNHDFKFRGKHLSCTITFGVTQFDPNLSMDRNFLAVDDALYEGKAIGKNCCVIKKIQEDERLKDEKSKD